ncbi:Phosphoribosylformylglycinamidine synthase subunit PurL [Streptomyces canarius]
MKARVTVTLKNGILDPQGKAIEGALKSQERMLMVLKREKEQEAEAIFRKWGLDFAVVGYTTPSKRFVVKHGGDVMADLPIKELGDKAPVYDRPHVETPQPAVIHAREIKPPVSTTEALKRLLATPELCSKRWVWEQYDHVIGGNTLQRPGGDAAVVRVQDGPKGLALTVDVTPRYCEADPFEGGKQAVAEAWRNITAVGGKPLAITDNLNFGNPERPEIMGQLVGCLKGASDACIALDFPIVSGNVSLYNETNGRGILPTPSIGGVGLLDDFEESATLAFKAADEAILLIGDTQGWLGQSVYLRDICGREEGAPPPVVFPAEKRNGDVVRGMIKSGTATAVHDLSDGGLLVALAEMAMASGIGAMLDAAPEQTLPHAWWFGEDQARYIVTVPVEHLLTVMSKLKAVGVPCVEIGKTGGREIVIEGETPVAIETLKAARKLAAGLHERQGLKHPLRAGNSQQQQRGGPACAEAAGEGDAGLGEGRHFHRQQPMLQPQHRHVVDKEDAIGGGAHGVEQSAAGTVEADEPGENGEGHRRAEQHESEAIGDLRP